MPASALRDPETTPVSLPRILGLSHAAIACADLERSLAFYIGVLGFTEHCRLNYAGTDTLMLVCLKISDEHWLELFDGRNLPAGADPLHQVAFAIDDAEGIRTRLATAGHRVPPRVWRGQMRNFGFTTPDPRGIEIEFVQATEESWMVRDRGRFLPADRLGHGLRAVRIAGPADPRAVADFYGQILGLPLERDGDGAWTVGIPGMAEHVRIDPAARHHALWLVVEDLAAAEDRLAAHREAWPIQVTPEGLVVHDPDGIAIHLAGARA